jgi:agmatine deiminase
MDNVYTSAALMRHPDTFNAISEILARNDISHHSIDTRQNIWIRDFMPVRTGIGFVKFNYESALYRSSNILTLPKDCGSSFATGSCSVFLDGGNVEVGEEKVLMCDMVFRNNPQMKKIHLTAMLESIFMKEIIFLPCEPDDTLGHVDGTARFGKGRDVLINDYSRRSRMLRNYQSKLEKAILKEGLNPIPMTYAFREDLLVPERVFRSKFPFADEYNPALGYYINFSKIDGLILCPQFRMEVQDSEAIYFLMSAFPKHKVVGIDCWEVGWMGGALNCITWTN